MVPESPGRNAIIQHRLCSGLITHCPCACCALLPLTLACCGFMLAASTRCNDITLSVVLALWALVYVLARNTTHTNRTSLVWLGPSVLSYLACGLASLGSLRVCPALAVDAMQPYVPSAHVIPSGIPPTLQLWPWWSYMVGCVGLTGTWPNWRGESCSCQAPREHSPAPSEHGGSHERA